MKIFLLIFAVVLIFFSCLLAAAADQGSEERKLHIVYLGEKETIDHPNVTHHLSLLDQVLQNISSSESLVYSYSRSFDGFAAMLTDKEKLQLAGMERVVSVFPNEILRTHTTRSWDFLHFPLDVNRNSPVMESDVIIGMLDTGIWPESESFNDLGLAPPPQKWKGSCINFNCTNKIIGARYYDAGNRSTSVDQLSPRDFEGHGTHTSSIAAGRAVNNASLYGRLAGGTARGGVPSARLAVYKVCWGVNGCSSVDILAAFDDAIADGVDIISISLGSDKTYDYFNDVIAIGAFHAMKKGILVSASGGNSGPTKGSVTNVAPWMLVSAASNTDRKIVTKLEIGSGHQFIWGGSINTFPTQDKFYPFIYLNDYLSCYGSNATSTKDKILLCGYNDQGYYAFGSGAEGVVVLSERVLDTEPSFLLPGLAVSAIQVEKLKLYINSRISPMAKIYQSEAIFASEAPVVATFSSRGPNTITANILKPDLSAPGVHILAAWSQNASMTRFANDTRMVTYNIISGTSMACPHSTGAAAYVKSFHPDWSPAAIMSALITTATPMDPSLSSGAEFAYGSGQINPSRAIDPGLVYEANVIDYVQMLCDEGYSSTLVSSIAGDKIDCSRSAYTGTSTDLNYPSMALYVNLYEPFAGSFTRTVTNVGAARSTYTVNMNSSAVSDDSMTVVVEPKVLRFEKLNEKKSFVVKVSGGPFSINKFASASITWSSGTNYRVRSVLVVYTDYTM